MNLANIQNTSLTLASVIRDLAVFSASWLGRSITYFGNTSGFANTTVWTTIAPKLSSIWNAISPLVISTLNTLQTGYGLGTLALFCSAVVIYHSLRDFGLTTPFRLAFGVGLLAISVSAFPYGAAIAI